MDGGVGGSMVSLVSPEVKHGISRVVNYIEDMYGLTVRPVRLCICFVYIQNLYKLMIHKKISKMMKMSLYNKK